MAMSRGMKIVAPFLRATSSTGLVHAVENTDTPATSGDGALLTVCGRKTMGADQPIKRFQAGVEPLCNKCYAKVVQARIDRLAEKKARYNTQRALMEKEKV